MTSSFMRILATYLHVLGVAVYLGGSIVMELVVGPAQKFIPPAQSMVMGKKTADRFLVLAWSALGLILASGVLRLFTLANESLLVSSRLWETTYGRTLLTMVSLWCVLVINGSLITFVFRPKLTAKVGSQGSAAQAQAHQQGQSKAAQWITRLTRVDLGVALVVAFLGSALHFGGLW